LADTRIEQLPSPGVTITRDKERGFEGDILTVNFGPHHSTQCVLCLPVDLDGDRVLRGTRSLADRAPGGETVG